MFLQVIWKQNKTKHKKAQHTHFGNTPDSGVWVHKLQTTFHNHPLPGSKLEANSEAKKQQLRQLSSSMGGGERRRESIAFAIHGSERKESGELFRYNLAIPFPVSLFVNVEAQKCAVGRSSCVWPPDCVFIEFREYECFLW